MSQREKMIAGMPYEPWDDELKAARAKAKLACYHFNHARPDDDSRLTHLAALFQTEQGFYVEPNFYCDYGFNIHLKGFFYANHHLTILDCAPVTIGDEVLIGPHVLISTATHPLSVQDRQAYEYAAPITIEDHVWIGGQVTILPGVTIGRGSVIGAGSVVTRDIPAGVVAVGNPCRVLREINDDDVAEKQKQLTFI
ncbi:sugar O-acetyltransferase [Vibrio stylophorae]|nr:sugar O-acetyltransferase [Vibrio stylophorae]